MVKKSVSVSVGRSQLLSSFFLLNRACVCSSERPRNKRFMERTAAAVLWVQKGPRVWGTGMCGGAASRGVQILEAGNSQVGLSYSLLQLLRGWSHDQLMQEWFPALSWHPIFFFLKYILLIILLQLSQTFPLCPPPPGTTLSSSNSFALNSCPWVVHVSSLASPIPILFLISTCLFCFQLCFLIPAPFPPFSPSQLITLQMVFIPMIWFLFWLFA